MVSRPQRNQESRLTADDVGMEDGGTSVCGELCTSFLFPSFAMIPMARDPYTGLRYGYVYKFTKSSFSTYYQVLIARLRVSTGA